MSGNVWEWTEDCWNANHNGASGDGSARMSGECVRRVVRGGAWNNNVRFLRSAVRDKGLVSSGFHDVGLRAARTF